MSELDWELIDRYLAGEATPAERKRLEESLAAEPEHAALLPALQRGVASLEGEVSRAELEAVWEKVASRTGMGRPESVPNTSPARRAARFTFAAPHRSRRWPGVALAAAAVLAFGAVIGRTVLLRTESRGAPVEQRVVTVPRGERARFRLPDGSEVQLAAGSTLRHPRAFPDRAREVALEGEAYFTVVHEEKRPFRVRAGDLVATDLGTEFLVRAYPDDGGARVVVRSGRVGVRPLRSPDSSRPGQVVRAGELGRIDSSGVPRVEPADTAAYFAWTAGTLVFDRTPLREALPQLSRWYDLDFRLADSSLGSIPLSGRLSQTLTPARLDLLAGSMGLQQVRRERTVTFYRTGAAPR